MAASLGPNGYNHAMFSAIVSFITEFKRSPKGEEMLPFVHHAWRRYVQECRAGDATKYGDKDGFDYSTTNIKSLKDWNMKTNEAWFLSKCIPIPTAHSHTHTHAQPLTHTHKHTQLTLTHTLTLSRSLTLSPLMRS